MYKSFILSRYLIKFDALIATAYSLPPLWLLNSTQGKLNCFENNRH